MCFRKKRTPLPNAAEVGAMKALIAAYNAKILPTEIRSLWETFDTPPLRAAEIEGIPVILLLGQYSVGKTSMISYLIDGNYPGANIGPEPTTDFFAHITYGNEPKTVPGTMMVVDKDYQFQTLNMFGDIFLNKLRCVSFNSGLLKNVSIIDTPGILSGEKQVAARGYDFARVIKVLATKVDRIYLMFDANKLDISDEYKEVIQILEGHEEKVKIILNKADSVTPRELVQLRGALMWSLGKIMKCSEIPKVYIGSFWLNWNPRNSISHEAILEDLDALIEDVIELPNNYQIRRVNDVVRRARNLQVHTYIMDEILRTSCLFRKRAETANTETTPILLTRIYDIVSKKHRIVRNDFPDPVIFHEKAKDTESKNWRRIDRYLNNLLESFFTEDVPPIMSAAIDSKKIKVEYKIKKPLFETSKIYEATQEDSEKRSNKEPNLNQMNDEEKMKSIEEDKEMKVSHEKNAADIQIKGEKESNKEANKADWMDETDLRSKGPSEKQENEIRNESSERKLDERQEENRYSSRRERNIDLEKPNNLETRRRKRIGRSEREDDVERSESRKRRARRERDNRRSSRSSFRSDRRGQDSQDEYRRNRVKERDKEEELERTQHTRDPKSREDSRSTISSRRSNRKIDRFRQNENRRQRSYRDSSESARERKRDYFPSRYRKSTDKKKRKADSKSDSEITLSRNKSNERNVLDKRESGKDYRTRNINQERHSKDRRKEKSSEKEIKGENKENYLKMENKEADLKTAILET